MSAITDNDLKEIKDLINLKFEKMNEDLTDLKVDLATVKANLNGIDKRLEEGHSNLNKRLEEGHSNLNKRLEEGQSSLSKRLDGLDARLNTLIAVAFTGLLGIIAKLVFLK